MEGEGGTRGPGVGMEVTHMLRVQVSGLAVDAASKNPVVLLESDEVSGVLPIWIGHPEASAIATQLAGQEFERPLTHDLLRTLVEGFGARVHKVTITELRGNTFYAKIYLHRDDEIWGIDARPSDSIALALRAEAPIFIDRELFRKNSREIGAPPKLPGMSDDDPLKKYLEDPEPEPPEDFNL